MDDISILAADTVVAVLPYLTKIGDEVSKNIGKDIWSLITKAFKKDRDKALIQQFEQIPTNSNLQGKVELKLEELLETTPELAVLLKDKLKQLPGNVKQNIQSINGTGNISIQDTSSSQISINKV